MPERFLEKGSREHSSNPQTAPDKPAPMQSQEVSVGNTIPVWKWANDRGRRTRVIR